MRHVDQAMHAVAGLPSWSQVPSVHWVTTSDEPPSAAGLVFHGSVPSVTRSQPPRKTESTAVTTSDHAVHTEAPRIDEGAPRPNTFASCGGVALAARLTPRSRSSGGGRIEARSVVADMVGVDCGPASEGIRHAGEANGADRLHHGRDEPGVKPERARTDRPRARDATSTPVLRPGHTRELPRTEPPVRAPVHQPSPIPMRSAQVRTTAPSWRQSPPPSLPDRRDSGRLVTWTAMVGRPGPVPVWP